MKIGKEMESAVNAQINAELYSEYMYLSMAASFDAQNLRGFAHWMKKQAAEERSHAMKLYDFVIDRGGTVVLDAIAKPKDSWVSPLAAFEDAYKHEQHVTSLINKLYDVAAKEDDKAAQVMLHWFIKEQVEEEASAQEIVEKIRFSGGSPNGIMMLDHVLSKRGKGE